MDPELLEMPTDYQKGLDFVIRKTSKGGYADYSTSNFSRRESALTEAEQAAIASFGLSTLKDFLPKRPGEAELRIIKEMFDASVDGQEYDLDRWGAYYKPFGLGGDSKPANENASYIPRTIAPTTPSSQSNNDEPETTTTPVVVPQTTPSSDKAKDILALIRERQSKTTA